MPKTESNPISLGTTAPDFRLPDAAGAVHALSDHAAAPALLVAFISNRCPFVVGIRQAFAELARRNAPRGLRVIAINSNDAAAHPEETPERMAAEAEAQGYAFPTSRTRTSRLPARTTPARPTFTSSTRPAGSSTMASSTASAPATT